MTNAEYAEYMNAKEKEQIDFYNKTHDHTHIVYDHTDIGWRHLTQQALDFKDKLRDLRARNDLIGVIKCLIFEWRHHLKHEHFDYGKAVCAGRRHEVFTSTLAQEIKNERLKQHNSDR
jgi:hypothetical protein